MASIFIYGNVPSSKNSKVWTGRFLVSSPAVKQYLKTSEKQYAVYRNQFLKMIRGKSLPLNVKFRFVRKTRQRFDFINMAQIVQDLMVKYEWIADDDYTNLVPHFEPGVAIDKNNCGVEITVL